MTWWGTQLGVNIGGDGEPKRKYKFLVSLAGRYLFSLRTIDKPVATVDNKEYKLINHHFSFPGTVKWNSINMALIDIDGTASQLWSLLTNSGYSTPSSVGGFNTLEKKSQIQNLGEIKIYQLSSNQKILGDQVSVEYIEAWTLKNPIIEKISWGDLSYAEEDFVQYDLTIKYDWPEYESSGTLKIAK
tara:strand:+ start:169 stop:729 length:561 start_codon:yes stop_codon:yes gene_type:complete